MRKFNSTFRLLLALSAFGVLSLTSCQKDDDQFEFESMDMTYNLSLSQDILDVADIVVTYTDFQNQEKTETVTATKWTAKFTTNMIPANCSIQIKTGLKPGVELKKKKYTVKRTFSYTLQEHYKGGLKGWHQTENTERNKSVTADELEEQISRLSQSFNYKITPGPEGSYRVNE